MLSDIENLDIMLGENHFGRNGRDESVSSNFGRRPGSTSADELENNGENRNSATRDLITMPIMARFQLEVILVLRLTSCLVS